MKKISLPMCLALILIVFVFCFFLGKTSALNGAENKNVTVQEIRSETAKEETLPASKPSTEVKKVEVLEKPVPSVENSKLPPDRMDFPCGQAVQKDYSQQAVYSATMGDWRAHTGIDYKADIGTEVKSVWEGKVVAVYKDVLWGYTVEIQHEGELKSVYKNLEETVFVKKGETVSAGQAIGKVGDSAGVEKKEEPHLHFELLVNELHINPSSYIY